MMSELLTLLKYTRWATERVLKTVALLTPEAYTRDMGNSFASIRDTLVHIYGADRVWLGRIQGQSLGRTNPADFPEVESLQHVWLQVLSDWPKSVQTLNPQQRIDYQSFDGTSYASTLEEIVRHVVNHASYHRGQVATMLKQLKMPVVSTDLITFYRSQT